MSEAELSVQLRDLGKRLFQMKFSRASSPLENPLEIRTLRRRMAVIKTFMAVKAGAAAAAKLPEGKNND